MVVVTPFSLDYAGPRYSMGIGFAEGKDYIRRRAFYPNTLQICWYASR